MRKHIIFFASLVLAGFILTGCDILPGRSEPTVEPTVVVPVENASSGVISEGRLVPRQDLYLNFLATGEIGEVLVEKGDQVDEGQVLARLANDKQVEAAITTANLELEAAQQAYDRLIRLAELEQSQALMDLVDSRDAVIAASRAWEEIDTDETQEEIEQAEVDAADLKRELDDAQEAYDRYADLPEDNETRQDAADELEQAQKDYDEAVRQRDELVNARGRAKASLDIALAAEAEAQRTYDNLQDGADPERITLAEKRLENASAQLSAAQAASNDLELRAPFSGTIVDVNVIPGQIAAPGIWAFQLVDFSAWYLETTDLTEIEVVKIRDGQQVTAFLDALKDVELEGIVEEIGQVPGAQSGDVVYVVRIRLDAGNPLFRWGMTAEVNFEE
jgi:HlyD family secretion protein